MRMAEDFKLTVVNRSDPRPDRGIVDRVRSLVRKFRSTRRSRKSIAVEWGVDFDFRKPAVLTMPIPPWEVKAVNKGRCMSCWGRLVGRLDRRNLKFTGIRCVVCGKTVEGEEAASEYERMMSESIRNAMNQATGRAMAYDQDAPFALSVFPQFERETQEQFDRRIAASATRPAKKGRLTRRDFPAGSPGYFFLQAKVLMTGVEKMPRVVTAGSFGDIDLHDDGSATLRLPTEGERNDPQFLSYDMSQKLGCTMTAALMSAFACELAMKAIRLTLLDEARRDHDLLNLYEELRKDSRTRIEAAWPGIRPVLEKARHAFGRWRYFETAIGEQSIGTMLDTEQALALGKAARVLLDEAELAGLTCKVELDGRKDVKRTGDATSAAYKHDFTVTGGESGRPVASETD